MTKKQDHIDILKDHLHQKQLKNKSYSLRAFARQLDLSVTHLSMILSGKRALTKKIALRVIESLGLPEPEAKILLQANPRQTARHKKTDYEFVELEIVEKMISWVHYAILSLIEIPGTQFNNEWMAQRLGISVSETAAATQKLFDLGLMVKKEDTWQATRKSIKVENRVSTRATRIFHKSLLNRAVESLENDPVEIRNFSSVTFAMDPHNLEYARKRIIEFRRQLTAELEEIGTPTEVYNFTLQLFPVTKESLHENP